MGIEDQSHINGAGLIVKHQTISTCDRLPPPPPTHPLKEYLPKTPKEQSESNEYNWRT